MDILPVVPLGLDLIDQKVCDLYKYTCWPFLRTRCLIISPFLLASLSATASHPLWTAPFISLYGVISVIQDTGYTQILLSYNLWCVTGFL